MMSYLNNQRTDCQSNFDGKRRRESKRGDKDHLIRLLLTFFLANRRQKKDKRSIMKSTAEERHRRSLFSVVNFSLEPPAAFVCSTRRNEGEMNISQSLRDTDEQMQSSPKSPCSTWWNGFVNNVRSLSSPHVWNLSADCFCLLNSLGNISVASRKKKQRLLVFTSVRLSLSPIICANLSRASLIFSPHLNWAKERRQIIFARMLSLFSSCRTYCCWEDSMSNCRCRWVSMRVSIVLERREEESERRFSPSRRQFARSFDERTRRKEYLSMRLVVITRAKRILAAMSSLSFPSPSSFWKKRKTSIPVRVHKRHGPSWRRTEILASLCRASRLPVSMMRRSLLLCVMRRFAGGTDEKREDAFESGLPWNRVDD